MEPSRSRFEKSLLQINSLISLQKNDVQTYTQDFQIIRDFFFEILCKTSPTFKKIYNGTSLFGSHPNHVRINKPNEFDVLFLLCFKFHNWLDVIQDELQPGYVQLDFANIFEKLEDENGWEGVHSLLNDFLINPNNDLLNRSKLQKWIRTIIKSALKNYGNIVRGCKDNYYELIYMPHGLAHTIKANCPGHNISIDFVPAIKLPAEDWIELRNYRPLKYYMDKWYAVPKPSYGNRFSKKYSFFLCNPSLERNVLMEKQNLKIVFRLLKSIRNNYGMKRVKSYFFTTAFLWEIENQRKFWNEPVGVILVHMLDKLAGYFEEGVLPYFWAENMNLLVILYDEEMEEFASKWRKLYNTMRNYIYDTKISYNRIASHFKILEN